MAGLSTSIDLNTDHACKDGAAQDLSPALRDLAVRMANVPDCEFLESFCLSASALLDIDHLMIGRLNVYSNMIRTVCYVRKGKVVDNIVYALSGAPCERVMENRTCVYPSAVADQFPQDHMLRDMAIEGYVGAPMLSSDGVLIGLISGMSEKEFGNIELVQGVVEYFRNRIAFQLETTETLERYMLAYSGAEEGFWDWDLKTGAMMVSESVGKMLHLAPHESPRDLSALENLIHPEDREKFVTSVRSHLKTGEHFSLIIRFRSGDSAYRWVRTGGRSVNDNSGRTCRMIGSLINVDKWVRQGTLTVSDEMSIPQQKIRQA